MTAKEFILSIPDKVDSRKLEGVDTNFQFDVSGERGGQFTVIVKDGQVQALEGFEGQAKCVISGSDKSMFDLLNGKLNPMMALLTKKVRVSDKQELMKNARIIGLI